MKKLLLAALFAFGIAVGVEAAPTDNVTQADLQAIIQRLNKLEAENKAQADKIAELEGRNRELAARSEKPAAAEGGKVAKVDDGAEVSESGKVVKARSGKSYFLADATANIFEPLSESGLQVTPYGYLVFEGVYSTHGLDMDWSADFVHPKGSDAYRNHNSSLSMQDSILGIQFATPEALNGWKFSGKAEFDLAGGNADDYAFHWRHIYVDAQHESGWSVLLGQTWHLWKMVTPSEIDGAWMENTGHPYRRSPQIRVTKRWEWEDSSLEARVGFVKNGPNASTDRDMDGTLDSVASAWGWFEGALVYDHDAAWEDTGRRWLVGIGGMYGRDRSRRILGETGDGFDYGDADEYNSQMIMLAASVPFLDKFTLCGQVYAGENLGRIQAGCAQSVAFYDEYGDQRGSEITTVGGFIDLAYVLNDDWDFAVGYGFDNPQLHRGRSRGTYGINHNDRAYIDVFYHITSNFKLGFEYARLTTRYVDEGNSSADRFQFSAFYDF